MSPRVSLHLVKTAHTMAWAFFAGCILALPVYAWHGLFDVAWVLIALVTIEVGILAVNGWRCPLTDVAERFTDDRSDNFDIYLPAWLARHNKRLFGSFFAVGVFYTVARWTGWV